jgi:surface antigen
MVATDVAASITERANLPIAPNVANMAVSLSAKSELAQTDDTVVAKPQIIKPSENSRAITYYTVKAGDTVPSVAAKYNLSPSTVRWANNLESDALRVGSKLKILPVDGVLHTFKKGESVNGLAGKYDTSAQRITLYNDLDLKGPTSGQRLIIPNGVLPRSERPGYEEPRAATSGYGAGYTAGVSSSMARASAGNRYAPGNCTWYAYERRMQLGMPVGSFWGNANTWAINARAAGMLVNNTPSAGAVLVDTAGFYGHVAVVESVRGNGDIVVSEMNNYAYGGFNIVDNRTISAGQARAYQYIH